MGQTQSQWQLPQLPWQQLLQGVRLKPPVTHTVCTQLLLMERVISITEKKVNSPYDVCVCNHNEMTEKNKTITMITEKMK